MQRKAKKMNECQYRVCNHCPPLTFFLSMVSMLNSNLFKCMMRVGGSSRKAHRRSASTLRPGGMERKVIMISMRMRIIMVMRRIRGGVIEEAKKGLKWMMRQKKREVEGKTWETEEIKGTKIRQNNPLHVCKYMRMTVRTSIGVF